MVYRGIVRTPSPPFLRGGEVNFDYLPQRGESKKLKKGVGVWSKGRSS